MTAQSETPLPLNDVQLMLLKLFSRPISQKDTEAIQSLLLDYYDNMLQQEVDTVMEQKGISRTDFEKVLDEQHRTK